MHGWRRKETEEGGRDEVSERREGGREERERGAVLIHPAKILKATRITNHRPMLIIDNVCKVSNIRRR